MKTLLESISKYNTFDLIVCAVGAGLVAMVLWQWPWGQVIVTLVIAATILTVAFLLGVALRLELKKARRG